MSRISANDEAVLLACTNVAGTEPGHTPLGPKGWASLATRMEDAGLQPADLLESSAADLESRLGIAPGRAEQVAGLLSRRGQLAFELERLGRLGIWALTIVGDTYPAKLFARLGDAAPPVLFGLGLPETLHVRGLAVVGSRDAPSSAIEFAREAGATASRQGWATVSGAARGVDRASMRGSLEAGGPVVGVTADGLERHLRDATLRAAFASGAATYVTPFHPSSGFSAGTAMGRNKIIYCLADVGLVLHAAHASGGTWTGAVEALDAGWLPLFVSAGDAGPGAQPLIERGGHLLEGAGLDDLPRLAKTAVPEASRAAAPDDGAQQTLF